MVLAAGASNSTFGENVAHVILCWSITKAGEIDMNDLNYSGVKHNVSFVFTQLCIVHQFKTHPWRLMLRGMTGNQRQSIRVSTLACYLAWLHATEETEWTYDHSV